MSDKESNPPKGALWFLQNVCPGDNEALTGDLIEKFREGQTRGWFWRQAGVACAVCVLGEIRGHWPHLCYAITGTAAPMFLWTTVQSAGLWLHWWIMPWPWSQLILDLSPTVLLALAVLPILAAGLLINGTFRWSSLFRTGVINLALITFGHYLSDVFQGLRHKILPELQVLIFFSTFLIAAW